MCVTAAAKQHHIYSKTKETETLGVNHELNYVMTSASNNSVQQRKQKTLQQLIMHHIRTLFSRQYTEYVQFLPR